MAQAPAARLFTGKDLEDAELHPLGLGLAAVFTSKAPGKDSANEDSCAIIPYDEKSGIIAVADGCGGLPEGAQASQLAISALRNAVRQALKRQASLREAILEGIDKANRDVIALGLGAGTTLAIAEIRGNDVRPYHVGDSQIMVIGPMGKIKLQTKSHSPVGYAVEAGLMDVREAMHHSERHIVSNLIGDASMSIEIGPSVELSPRDTVLVASDGLFDNLHASEIAAACRKAQLLAACGALADSSRRRMQEPAKGEPSKPDDLTFVAYRRRVAVE